MFYVRKQNKYHAKSTTYNGITYHSAKEAAYAEELDWLLKAKEIRAWERQVKISFEVCGQHICNYYVDFRVYHTNGTTELVEVKGFETDLWRLKWKLLEAIYSKEHPEILLTVVK